MAAQSSLISSEIKETKENVEAMKLIDMLVNREFKQFSDAFYGIYSNAKEGKEAIALESDLWEAFQKLSQLVLDEVDKISKKMDEQTEITEQDRSYITFVKGNPLIFHCTLFHYSGRNIGCAKIKKELSAQELEPKGLCLNLLNFSGIMGNYADIFKRGFIVFPEFKQDPSLLFECIDFSTFRYLYRHFQVLNLSLPSGFGKNEKDWFQSLYLYFLESGGGNLIPPLNCSDPLTWRKKLKEYVCQTKILSIEVERKLLLKIIKVMAVHCRNSQENGASNALSENLFFLLQQGISLQGENSSHEPWFSFLPWESLKDPHLFLFDHIESEKSVILEYWRNHHPNLVLEHLVKGNFFIANLLIELGLKEPEMDPVKFIAESIQVGLKSSREVKKFHAYFLLQFSMGLIDPEDFYLLNNLLAVENYAKIQEIVNANIPKMVHHYLQNHYEDIVIKKSTFQDLNKVMMALYKDYSIALSAIYGIPILGRHQTTKLYRGVTIPKTSFNLRLAEHWIDFGHRASYYAMWGHGYNRGVRDELEEGPLMVWMGNSDTTRTAASLATNYVYYGREDSDAFLLGMKYQPGEPIFFGNLCPPPGKFANEIELPCVFSQNIEGVYHPNSLGIVEDVFYQKDTVVEEPTLLKGEPLTHFSERATAIATRHQEGLAKELLENPLEFESEFSDYLKKFDPNKMLLGFERNLESFGSFKERMDEIRRYFKDLTTLSNSNTIVNHILGYTMHQKVLPALEAPNSINTVTDNNGNTKFDIDLSS